MTSTIGRPTKYKKEFCEQAKKLCLKGFIDTEIADFFDVDVATLNRWKLKHEAFRESLKEGKRHSDDKVVDALYNRALGFESTEIKTEEIGEGQKVTRTVKQIAGDTTAQIFWLKNRQPDQWRNNPESEVVEDKGGDIVINIIDAVKPGED